MTPEKDRDSPLKQGTLDLVVLSVLEQGRLYGLEILKEINIRSAGAFDFREGSLYPVLHRMVKANWIDSEWQPSTTGGPARKYYHLTDGGQQALARKRKEWRELKTALDRLALEQLHWMRWLVEEARQ
jgi:PadR family transcriptional regulator, regulatory protein PadR